MSLIYRFRMLSDENDNFVRDFEVPANYTLLQLNDFILKMLHYEPCMASFFTSNSEWKCLKEYTLMDMGEGFDDEELDQPEPMEKVRLDEVLHYLNDRLIYLFDPINERAFYMEVIEASEPQADMTYPRLQFEHSPAPDQYDPEANEQSGSIFDEMMGDYNDFDGDDSYDDEY